MRIRLIGWTGRYVCHGQKVTFAERRGRSKETSVVRRWIGQTRILWLLFVLNTTVGCSTLRLPAIDPSGERIFLPAPGYTTLNRNHSSDYVKPSRPGNVCNGPVFEQPDAPDCELPPILPNTTKAKSPPITMVADSTPTTARILVPGPFQNTKSELYESCPEKEETDNRQRVVLTPHRQIAPVGSEVILIGGLCGSDGYYRMHEKLEWSLTQGSVGQFVDPGKSAVGKLRVRGHLAALKGEPLPILLSNNYALATSSKRVQVLTRGTARPSDDIFILQGQAWISVTSATEGETYVTLVAPKVDGWEQRQEMAVVHWIDGQWTLPASVHSRTIDPIALTTTINRKLTAAPVLGWIVRYEIVSGEASFEGSTTTVEIETNEMGEAPVRVIPTSARGGAAKVKATIIRPAGIGSGVTDRLIVGEGTADVSWSTAMLDVQLTGPEAMEVNETGVYRINVTNSGTMQADSSLVRVMIPPGVDLVSSTPAATTFGRRLDWNLGPMAPGESSSIELTYIATQPGVIRHCASAQPAGGTTIESCITTLVTADFFYIEMVGPNPDIPLLVGQNIQYQVTITNRGNQRLNDVILSDRFDAGLQHSEGPSPIERSIGALDPGESRQLGLTFQVVAPGRHCHTLEATASGTKPARASACITAEVQPQTPAGSLTVSKSGPQQAMVGEQITFDVTIQNTGQGTVNNIQIIDQYDPEFRPVSTNPIPANSNQNQIIWYLSKLDPGEQKTFQVTCQALYDAPNSCSRVTVQSGDGMQVNDETCIPILKQPGGAATPIPGANIPGANIPGANISGADVPSASAPATAPGPVPGPGPGAAPTANAGQPGSTSTAPPNFGTGSGTATDATGLTLSIEDRGDRFQVGNDIEYFISIRNDSQSPDTNIILTIKLPPQLRLKEYSGPTTASSNSADWRTINMAPIRSLRAGESVQYTIRATVEQAGEIATRAEVTSLRTVQATIQEARSLATP